MAREKWLSGFKQNNGKENVFKHLFQGYILPKDKQSMLSVAGYNVDNSLGKGGGGISWYYPYNGVRINDKQNFASCFKRACWKSEYHWHASR